MKKVIHIIFMLPLMLHAQEDATVREQISLEGLLELCKKSNNPEDLEKAINTNTSAIHNIDLNDDGQTDYLYVEDITEENLHMLFIRTEIKENEDQDIAVIEIEKAGEQVVYVRAIADSTLFGEDLSIEPKDEKELNSGGKGGPYMSECKVRLWRANCWGWPIVKTLYMPSYRPWVSPYRIRRLPPWYSPWRPVPNKMFRAHVLPPMAFYKPFPYRRAALANKLYKIHRRQVKLARMHHRMNKGNRPHGKHGWGGRGRR
jgi:hypothetical protein